MEFAKVVDIVKNLPYILQYFVPGYIGIYVYRYLRNAIDSNSGNAEIIGLSTLYSCLAAWPIEVVFKALFSNQFTPNGTTSLITWAMFTSETLLVVIVAVILIKLRNIKKIEEAFSRINNTSLEDDVFGELGLYMDKKKKVILHCGMSVIYGVFLMKGTEDDNIVIGRAIIKENDKITSAWYQQREWVRIIIPCSKIDYIEVFSDDNEITSKGGNQNEYRKTRKELDDKYTNKASAELNVKKIQEYIDSEYNKKFG